MASRPPASSPPRRGAAWGGLLLLAALLCAAIAPQPAAAAPAVTIKQIVKRAKELQDWMVALRRDLHKIPEKGSNEFATARYLRSIFFQLNMTYK